MLDFIQEHQEEEYSFPYHYITQYTPEFSQSLHDSWGINYAATLEFLLKVIAEEPFVRCLDVGCGDGRLVKELDAIFPKHEIVGVDYSERAIALARVMHPMGQFKRLDITKESMGESFDLVTVIEVLEHIHPRDAGLFVQSLAKQLDAGGKLLLTVPHSNKPVEYKHYRHFTVASINEALCDAFDIVAVVPFERLSITKKLVDTILCNRLFILNNSRMRNAIYSYYKRALFHVRSERDCARLFVKAVRKS